MNRKKGILLLALVFFFLLLSQLPEFLEPVKPQAFRTADQEMYDYRLTNLATNKLDHNGKLAYTLNADSLTHFPARKISHLGKPVLIQYSDKNGRTVTTAKEATLADSDKIIEMRGNVVTVQRNRSGDTIARSQTDRLTIQLQ